MVFPENLQKTLPNLVVFILRHTTHNLKLETSLNICSKTCVNSNIDASSQRVLRINNEVINLQRRIHSMENHIARVVTRLALKNQQITDKVDSEVNEEDETAEEKSWWVDLLKRYTHLLKWTRNRKFLQKKNLRLLHSILKSVAHSDRVDEKRLVRILRQYETHQRQLAHTLKSRGGVDIDGDFLQDLKEINNILDEQRTRGQNGGG